ncbi:MAG: ribose-phosphate pyrophosphokinase [Candidatus Paceibacteria bacterium]|jgi:ribose-phosphate pyrophosphokinase
MDYGKTMVFATNSGAALAAGICERLSVPLGGARVSRFKDGEVDVQICEDVRESDVFIVASLVPPAENFLELIHMASAAKKASASRVTLVISYMGYARSDRKAASRTPIGVKLAFQMLAIASPDRMIVLDIHAEQSLAVTDSAIVDHLFGSAALVPVVREVLTDDAFVIASPDRGGTTRAGIYAKFLGEDDDFVILSKMRTKAGEVDEGSTKIIGDVKGKTVVFVDDMIDGGGTMIAGAKVVKSAGATRVIAVVTHGIFSGDALQRLQESDIDLVFVTDSIHHGGAKLNACSKIRVVSVACLLADAVRRTHEGDSLSALIL